MIERLRRVEALFARPGTDGERMAADAARSRILERLGKTQREEPSVEIRFALQDVWSRRLLLALLRRYDIEPFRRRGQRRNTVRARMPRRFLDEVLWPQFQALNHEMSDHFDRYSARIVEEALHAKSQDAEERR